MANAERSSRYGPFFSCSGYPECRNIRKIGGGKSTPPKPTCGESELLERRSRRGIFYSCSRYPKCDFALNNWPVLRPCPKCGAPYLLEKTTKREGHIASSRDPSRSTRIGSVAHGRTLLPARASRLFGGRDAEGRSQETVQAALSALRA